MLATVLPSATNEPPVVTNRRPDPPSTAPRPTFEHDSTALMERPDFDDDDMSTPGESAAVGTAGQGVFDAESTDPAARAPAPRPGLAVTTAAAMPQSAESESTGRYDLSSLPSADVSEMGVEDSGPSPTAVMQLPPSMVDDPVTYTESLLDPVEVMKWRAGPPAPVPPPLEELTGTIAEDEPEDSLAATLPAISLAAVAEAARIAGQEPPRPRSPSASGRAVSMVDGPELAAAPSPPSPPSSPFPEGPAASQPTFASFPPPPMTPVPGVAAKNISSAPRGPAATDELAAPPSTPPPMPLPPPFAHAPVTMPIPPGMGATLPSTAVMSAGSSEDLADAYEGLEHRQVTAPSWSTPQAALMAAQEAVAAARRLAPTVVEDELQRAEEALAALARLLDSE